MNLLRTVTLIATVIVFTNFANAQNIVLFGVVAESCGTGTGGGSGEGSLYIVDPNTGNMEIVGPTGFNGLTALVTLDDGRLLASARQGSDTSILIEINPFTGSGSLIGVLGNNNNPNECGRFPGLTYDSASNTLYGIGINCDGLTRNLFTINPLTAQVTNIGPLNIGGGFGGNGLAIRDDGTLFGSSFAGTNLNLFTVNPNTGAANLVGVMDTSGLNPEGVGVNGLDFHPITQELFASSVVGEPGINDSFLLTIDESAPPSFNVVGETLDCFDGLVFAQRPARPIPTLSEWGLITMAGVLGLVGLIFFARKKGISAT